MLCIVGAPRSGFAYICKVIQQATGKQVLHEKYGKDGIAAWWLPMRQKSGDTKFKDHIGRAKHVIYVHQVRHPLLSISSNAPRMGRQWKEIPACYIDDSLIVQAAKAWLWYNEQAEQMPCKMRYRVESALGELPAICQLLGVGFSAEIYEKAAHVSRAVNSSYRIGSAHKRYNERATWERLEAEAGTELASRIALKAREYGYED